MTLHGRGLNGTATRNWPGKEPFQDSLQRWSWSTRYLKSRIRRAVKETQRKNEQEKRAERRRD